ncbi:GPCR family 2 secretin-like [Trinorchestia longiramus]|nr:GPCR family 2 secretin-like [Trinorchestia longiramus]
MLEAVHMYTLVAYVVKKDGLFDRKMNMGIGWGISLVIVGISVAFEWDNYGASYHCWLQMDTGLLIAQQLPIIVLMIMTFTLIEAAGAAEYKPLKGMDQKQLTSAKFSQRTNLIIVPMVYAHWILGTLSEYQQNLALYSIFSIMNGWLGAMVFFFHCSNNQQVREKLSKIYANVRGRSGT